MVTTKFGYSLHALYSPKISPVYTIEIMVESSNVQKVLVVGAGPVGALAALYAAKRGDNVHVYELRAGKDSCKTFMIDNTSTRNFCFVPLLNVKFPWFESNSEVDS